MNLTTQQYADMEVAHRTWDENERVRTQPLYDQTYHAFRYATERMQEKLDEATRWEQEYQRQAAGNATALYETDDAHKVEIDKLKAEIAKLRKVINIGNKLRRTGPPCECKTCVKLQGLYDQALHAADIDQREGKGGEDGKG